jgi:hypothetical protein
MTRDTHEACPATQHDRLTVFITREVARRRGSARDGDRVADTTVWRS